MMRARRTLPVLPALLLAGLLLLPVPGRLLAAGAPPARPPASGAQAGLPAAGAPAALLPEASCGPGWSLEGKALLYDKETLSDRIDGEAELFFPYGFQRMTAGRYATGKTPGAGMDVEIYLMGSPLDAFGMYANYRQKEGRTKGIGAESNLADYQLFFYQGRYFVHLQITGADPSDQAALAACGRVVAARLPGEVDRPPQLAVLDRPDLVKGSERYLPESLLGYDFLNRGLLADATVPGAQFQVFYLVGSTVESASAALQRYRSQLTGGKIEAPGKDLQFLEGVDPLYGPVAVLRKGPCLVGALKFGDWNGIRGFLESFCRP
jgi:hypothetical protein